MNNFDRQSGPFSGNTYDWEGPYWQVKRKNDMSAFDNLPVEVRNYMNEHFCHMPADEALFELQMTHNNNVNQFLEMLKKFDSELNSIDVAA